MSFAHMLNETCYVEDPVKVNGIVKLDGDGEIVFTGKVVATKCLHLRKQRVFATQGTTGNAGERISENELVTSVFIDEAARVWIPGRDKTKIEQSLIPKQLEHQARPYGGLTLYHTFL